jgi:hypothetical protein
MRRRRLLSLGLVSAAVLALGGGALALLQPGLREGKLSEAAREVIASIGRALLDGSLPSEEQANRRALEGLIARVETLASGLAPHAQSELSQLLALMASAAGRAALAGVRTEWRSAPVAEIQSALQSMRVSRVGLRQQAYQALHDIVGSAYFSDPSTWSVLGYPGPLRM